MPGHVLDACFVEDLQTAGLLAASCASLERPMVGGFASSADTELASRIAELTSYGAQIRYLSAAELRVQQSIQADHPALSAADAEALVIAQSERAVLLTCDGPLRKAALAASIEVHGVIGELRRLIGRVVIDPPKALTSLDGILDSGSRLPAGEVESARRDWSRAIDRERGLN